MNSLLRKYRIFDVCIACDFPLPGLIVLEDESPDWRIKLQSEIANENEYEWFHSWKDLNGAEVMACARLGEHYLLRFNGLARFSIDFAQQKISVSPENDCPQNTLAHLLVDQVIPRTLCHQGRMVVHASAVELPNGQAVAFTGISGQGKSTLATAFFQAGYGLITDDCLLLENRGGVVYAVASYPSLRLWPDSAQAMVNEDELDGARFSEMAHYTHKKQLLFEAEGDSAAPRWVRLANLYILESPQETEVAPAVEIKTAGGMASIMLLIESLFALDVVEEGAVRRGFETVRQVAAGVAVKRLMYSRDYGFLPKVIELVSRESPDSG